jgi:nucleoside-diphosphate-sugar epimerase
MRIAIAGAHGKIAMRLIARLADRGDALVGLIRNPEQSEEIRAQGAEPVVCDLEHAAVAEIAAAVTGCDAVVFAAGAGPRSGHERKLTMDRDGAIKLLQAATRAEVPRYLIISSIGAENPPGGDDVFSVYLRAKADADLAVQASDRNWTIVRPGALTNDPGTGRVRIDATAFRGRIPREDVAAVLEVLLHVTPAPRRTLYLNGGKVPIQRALETLLAGAGAGAGGG